MHTAKASSYETVHTEYDLRNTRRKDINDIERSPTAAASIVLQKRTLAVCTAPDSPNFGKEISLAPFIADATLPSVRNFLTCKKSLMFLNWTSNFAF
jgi:hypothetical protein